MGQRKHGREMVEAWEMGMGAGGTIGSGFVPSTLAGGLNGLEGRVLGGAEK